MEALWATPEHQQPCSTRRLAIKCLKIETQNCPSKRLICQNASNINRQVSEYAISDVHSNTLNRYFLLNLTYHLRNFGGRASQNSRGEGRPRRAGGRSWRQLFKPAHDSPVSAPISKLDPSHMTSVRGTNQATKDIKRAR